MSSQTALDDGIADRDAYTSPEVYEQEMERVFNRSWVYVGHTSEVPERGDYKLAWIGRQQVIVVRDAEGAINVHYNRCSHRGSTLCEEATGNYRYFKCPYHGWTYDTDGTLVAVPIASRVADDFRKEDFGLESVARVGEHRGFIFASATPDIADLPTWLGPAGEMIDAFVDFSPIGELSVTAGRYRTRFRANWKFVGMDGYHPTFVHRSVRDAMGVPEDGSALDLEAVTGESTPNLTRDMGNGHVRLDYWPTRVQRRDAYLAEMEATEGGREYVRLLIEARGESRAKDMIAAGGTHTAFWPNLQLIDAHIRVIRPISANLTEVESYPAFLKGVPEEINVQRLRASEFSYGAAGFITPDDYDIFERNQLGLHAGQETQVRMTRGLGRERLDERGDVVGHYSDEVPQRGQLRQWRRQMHEGRPR